jgi:hypothetical protein
VRNSSPLSQQISPKIQLSVFRYKSIILQLPRCRSVMSTMVRWHTEDSRRKYVVAITSCVVLSLIDSQVVVKALRAARCSSQNRNVKITVIRVCAYVLIKFTRDLKHNTCSEACEGVLYVVFPQTREHMPIQRPGQAP